MIYRAHNNDAVYTLVMCNEFVMLAVLGGKFVMKRIALLAKSSRYVQLKIAVAKFAH